MPGGFVDTVRGFVLWWGDQVVNTHGDEEVPPHSVCFHGKTVREVATEEIINAVAEKLEQEHNLRHCRGIIPLRGIKAIFENYLIRIEVDSVFSEP